jgi:hypothetical protein
MIAVLYRCRRTKSSECDHLQKRVGFTTINIGGRKKALLLCMLFFNVMGHARYTAFQKSEGQAGGVRIRYVVGLQSCSQCFVVFSLQVPASNRKRLYYTFYQCSQWLQFRPAKRSRRTVQSESDEEKAPVYDLYIHQGTDTHRVIYLVHRRSRKYRLQSLWPIALTSRQHVFCS